MRRCYILTYTAYIFSTLGFRNPIRPHETLLEIIISNYDEFMLYILTVTFDVTRQSTTIHIPILKVNRKAYTQIIISIYITIMT